MTVKKYDDIIMVEIYFNDLNKKTQKELLKTVNVKEASEMNWDIDVLPLTILEFELEAIN